jgi:hypothetical protein
MEAAIRAINISREAVYGGFSKYYASSTKIYRMACPIGFFGDIGFHRHPADKEAGGIICETFLARQVRTYQRRDAGVRAGGGRPESGARERRSLDVDQRS